MPRNDQVIRQWHLIRLLESSHGLTLQEMLNELPADCLRHPRTVRRDFEALEAARFPLGPKFRVQIFLAHGNGLRSLGRHTLSAIIGNGAIDNGAAIEAFPCVEDEKEIREPL
jgi:predicted DNA-binding transcriptional regulator YafY